MVISPKYVLCIHAGAGTIDRNTQPDVINQYRAGLEEALAQGKNILADGGSALDAVQAAVISMENNHLFNASKGAVYNSKGKHELDASIMDGKTLSCGAVAGVKTIKSPISAARAVMEKTNHVMLAGEDADKWAKSIGLEIVPNTYFDDEYRYNQWQKLKGSKKTALDHSEKIDYTPEIDAKGTVGAVALDLNGNLAAATSTGGMTNKMYGRIGDSPIIGAGTYANNASCAVSCTGTGEQFIRHVIAHSLHDRIILTGQSLSGAAKTLVMQVLKKGDGGLIAIDKSGNFTIPYNSDGMFRGVCDSSGIFKTMIWES